MKKGSLLKIKNNLKCKLNLILIFSILFILTFLYYKGDDYISKGDDGLGILYAEEHGIDEDEDEYEDDGNFSYNEDLTEDTVEFGKRTKGNMNGVKKTEVVREILNCFDKD